jgi:hypothetical protein
MRCAHSNDSRVLRTFDLTADSSATLEFLSTELRGFLVAAPTTRECLIELTSVTGRMKALPKAYSAGVVGLQARFDGSVSVVSDNVDVAQGGVTRVTDIVEALHTAGVNMSAIW